MTFDGADWNAIVPEPAFVYHPFSLWEFGGELLFAGDYSVADSQTCIGLGRWDGQQVKTFGRGFDESVSGLTPSGGQLFVSGKFGIEYPQRASTALSTRIERRVGASRFSAQRPNATVRNVVTLSGETYLLGDFNVVSGLPNSRVARWNHGEWLALPNPLIARDGRSRSPVHLYDIAEWRGHLFVCGDIVSGQPKPAVLGLIDGYWESVGAETEPYGLGMSLAVYQDRLFVAGEFLATRDGGHFGLAMYDGVSWQSPGATMPDGGELAVHEGDLIAAGGVVFGGGATSIAAFDGAAWRALGGADRPQEITALRSEDDGLYVGARSTGDATKHQVFRWNGATWSAIAGEFDGRVNAIAAYDGRLAVGGEFVSIDGVVSAYFAEYACADAPRPGDLNCDAQITVADIGPFVLALLDPVRYAIEYPDCDASFADTNDDGFVTVADIGRFVERLAG